MQPTKPKFRGPGQPAKYDPLELAALYCDGMNQGQTAGAIVAEILEAIAMEQGPTRKRQTKREIAQAKARILKAIQRSRERLMRPWFPKMGEGIHKSATSTELIVFGVPMFMGRPLPKPIGIVPREAASRGRPKKPRG